jgi:hypothetical protein
MDNIKSKLDEVLAKPVDRAEFLRGAGLMILGIIGAGRIIHALGLLTEGRNSDKGGYGRTPYGG